MAHRCVVVCISSKHQHGSAHYHSGVQIAKKSTVFKNCPLEMKKKNTLLRKWLQPDKDKAISKMDVVAIYFNYFKIKYALACLQSAVFPL